jgi:hypothetical protein
MFYFRTFWAGMEGILCLWSRSQRGKTLLADALLKRVKVVTQH